MFHTSARIFTRAVVVVGGSALSAHNVISHAQQKEFKDNKVVIVGGGTAGVGLAAQLKREGIKNIVIIEPKDVHYYQPLWTLVGGGLKTNIESARPQSEVIPKGVQWVRGQASKFLPDTNAIELSDGAKIDYDYLVVAAGIQVDWNKIPGLLDSIGKPDTGVVSIYDFNYAAATSAAVQGFKGGRAIFTFPPTLIKCAGAPQKIMWLFEESIRDRGIRDKASVEYFVPGEAMFGIKKYSEMLEALRKERDVKAAFKRELVKVDGTNKVATFKNLNDGTLIDEKFDLLHVTPPMSAPDFIKNSPLSNAAGWLDVDRNTLQSTKYQNIFGIGDCTSTPNSKTAAAITSQAPVVVHNMIQAMKNQPLDGSYNGYASCPLVVGKNRVILAEFGYDGKILETFDWDTGKFPLNLLGQEGSVSQRFFAWMKKEFFAFAYWNMWIHGYWFGTNGPFKPNVRKEEQSK